MSPKLERIRAEEGFCPANHQGISRGGTSNCSIHQRNETWIATECIIVQEYSKKPKLRGSERAHPQLWFKDCGRLSAYYEHFFLDQIKYKFFYLFSLLFYIVFGVSIQGPLIHVSIIWNTDLSIKRTVNELYRDSATLKGLLTKKLNFTQILRVWGYLYQNFTRAFILSVHTSAVILRVLIGAFI